MTTISSDVKERIFAAADALYAESATGDFPTIEAVRQASRAGMNNVVQCMKEWRQGQRKQVQAVREPLPGELHAAVQALGQSLWEAAQQLANESLESARVAFETEKMDLVELSVEQSEAFEAQAVQLEELEGLNARLRSELERFTVEVAAETESREKAEHALHAAKGRLDDLEKQVGELRSERDQARKDTESLRSAADILRTERDKALQREELLKSSSETTATRLAESQNRTAELQSALSAATAKLDAVDQARKHSAEQLEKLQGECERVRADAASVREDAAALRGQLEVMKAQNAELLAVFKGRGKDNEG